MKKVQFIALFWTLVIAIPFTALALGVSAYLTNHLIEISTGVGFLFQKLFTKGRDLLLEAELVGLIVGQLIIFAILAITWLVSKKELSHEG